MTASLHLKGRRAPIKLVINGQRRYKYLVLGRYISHFVKHHSDSTKTFSETNIFNMFELLIYNIFVMFGGRVFFV